jgi:GTP-binding protein
MTNKRRVEFIKSAADPADFPRASGPEVAFVGRSNVGKSSLLTVLAGVKRLAFTSKTPGRTQLVNFFRVGEWTFVDLPGYGFAKAPASVRRRWESLVTSYLFERDALRLVLLLVDARREPVKSDLEIRDLLASRAIPYIVVATKADKLSGNRTRRQLRQLQGAYGHAEKSPVIAFSAVTSEGRKELWKAIEKRLRAPRPKPKPSPTPTPTQ